MYIRNHDIHKYHLKNYGNLDEFGYKDFIPLFTAEKFNADEWVALFRDAGAKFTWNHSDDGLRINLPSEKSGDYAFVLKSSKIDYRSTESYTSTLVHISLNSFLNFSWMGCS